MIEYTLLGGNTPGPMACSVSLRLGRPFFIPAHNNGCSFSDSIAGEALERLSATKCHVFSA